MIEPTYKQTDVHGNLLTEEQRETLDDYTYRPTPFTKTNWKSGDARDTWRDLLQRAASAKRHAEWKSVLSGETDRKAAIIHVNNNNREKWLRRIGEYGLSYRDIRYSEPYDGFSHKFFPTDKSDPNRITYAVIAESDDVADKMEEAELDMDGHERHDMVGELLGFPECCRKQFNEIWLDKGLIDPMYEVSCNTDSACAVDGDHNHVRVGEPNPYTNVMYRYFGWSFITHIPCSWDCEKSTEIGRARGGIMADDGYQDAANAMYNFLDKPMTWTGLKGFGHVKNDSFIGGTGTSCYWDKKKIVWGEEHEGGSVVEE